MSWNTTGAANGGHQLSAVAHDAAGNTTTSSPVNVTVDNVAPTVSLTGPTEGATVSGTVNLTATASDNVGVTKVQFFWGRPSGVAVNLELLAEDTTAPYGPVSWNSTAAVNGPNKLFVRAFDAAGNTTMRSINVIVNNPANNLAPVVPGKTIPRTFDPVTGAVTGVMNVRDPEQAQLSYTLAYPPSRGGTVSFDQPTGVFTYTPSQAARDQAAGTSGLDYDTFGVSISDGIATVQTSVTVQVAQTLPTTTSITNTPVTAGSGPSGAAISGGYRLRDQLRQQQRHCNRHRDKPIRENSRCRGGSVERGGQTTPAGRQCATRPGLCEQLDVQHRVGHRPDDQYRHRHNPHRGYARDATTTRRCRTTPSNIRIG